MTSKYDYNPHKRWYDSTVRSQYDPANPAAHQCYDCLFFHQLMGVLGFDWGVCSNAESEWDTKLRFEHDGCPHWQLDPHYDDDTGP